MTRNLAVVEAFACLPDVLPHTTKVSPHDGAIRSALDKAGRSIGGNQLHIVATRAARSFRGSRTASASSIWTLTNDTPGRALCIEPQRQRPVT